MEDLVSEHAEFWQDRSVLVTGHTGFKGSWLSLWLGQLGARVHGYALDPLAGPGPFEAIGIARTLESDTRADVRDLASLRRVLTETQPSVVFHLAAQPLVRTSYRDPVATFDTNVMGVVNVLEAARAVPAVEAVVVITSDKVYAPDGSGQAHVEIDRLGGRDPYSASKAAAEIVVAGYRDSFCGARTAGRWSARIATARAGNVIGGGDWAVDRLVPDCLRAFADGDPVSLRFPEAVRPWQHVLEPISGYVSLARQLCADDGFRHARAWNFGPARQDEATVATVAAAVADRWPGSASVLIDVEASHPGETGALRLNSQRAQTELGWRPRWSLDQAISATVEWFTQWLAGAEMSAFSISQLERYREVVV